MGAYWIAHVEVSDPDEYKKYATIASEAIAAHGGRFLARGGRYRQMEGRDRPRNVVAYFPSFEDAVACYESARYQEALSHARNASERDLVIVEASED